MKTERQRLFYLDLIRVAAAVLIVIYHFPFSIGGAVDPLHGTVNGSWGMTPVYCFFMVSGAALFHRYGREEKLPVKTFYKENGHYRLQPQNSSMEPIIVDEVKILGKVIGVFRMIK